MDENNQTNNNSGQGNNDSQFDAESFKNSILSQIEAKETELFDKVSAKAKDDIVKRLVGEEKKKWVPKDYEEIVGRSVEEMKKLLDDKEKEQQTKSKTVEEEQQKTQAEWDAYWNNQLEDMEKDGFLPPLPDEIAKKMADGKPLSEKDKQDPSVLARAELYGKARELKDQGYRDWANLELVYHKFLARQGRSRAEEAPVFRDSRGFSNSKGDSYTYEEIHNKSMAEIASGK